MDGVGNPPTGGNVVGDQGTNVAAQDISHDTSGRLAWLDGCGQRGVRVRGRLRAKCPDDLRQELATHGAVTTKHAADGGDRCLAATTVLDLDLAEPPGDVAGVDDGDEVIGELDQRTAGNVAEQVGGPVGDEGGDRPEDCSARPGRTRPRSSSGIVSAGPSTRTSSRLTALASGTARTLPTGSLRCQPSLLGPSPSRCRSVMPSRASLRSVVSQ
jgi:hypothetical protein